MKKLAEYQRKRDFTKSPEPKPAEPQSKKTSATPGMFVVQKHAASHLHYDFRLEMGGALKSWAVPKGIPFGESEKHLAVQVEDHPLDYARFEGTIPKGAYGGGTVMVWDLGEYTVSGDDPLKAYASGKLHLHLKGKKLRGEWTLVRTRVRAGAGKENWLLIKTGDSVRPVSARKDDESALSGRTMKGIAQEQAFSLSETSPKPVRRGLRPEFVQPMKAKLVQTLPDHPGWIYEIKFDGYRAIAVKDSATVVLYSRNHKLLQFPELANAVARLSCESAVFDGEIVVLDAEGRSSFQLLQARQTGDALNAPLYFYIFDLLHLDGVSFRDRPMSERKKLLAELLPKTDSPLRFSGALPGNPEEILSQIKAHGLEGIVAKRADSRYEPGKRSGAWIKVKCLNEQEFVIGGYTFPKGTRSHIGALLIGYYEQGRLRFAGKVGTGFSESMLEKMLRDFEPLRTATCPFVDIQLRGTTGNEGLSPAEVKRCKWIQPERVCQVRFTEWTREGKLRQPVFLGLRTDKAATEVVREKA
ncbi:MAG: non-homologous end-joining DNA ligase [Verrucomicrobia bacterium]|nr:non-homologous end-joining DNA ligase [Verrucomicrobiota bacterium]